MNIKFNKTQLATGLMVMTLLLIAVSKTFHISLLLYPAIAAAAAAIFVGDNSFRAGFCLMLIPSVRIFDNVSSGSMVNILLALPVAAYILESRRINFTALSHVIMLTLWDACHVIVFGSGFKVFAANLSSILVLYYVECVLVNSNVKLVFSDIARKLAFGCIFSAVIRFVNIATQASIQAAWDNIADWRLQGYAGDPNYFSLYLLVAISMLLILGQDYKRRDYIYIFTLIGMTLLTYSKMSLGILIVIMIYFMGRTLYSIMSHRNKFMRRVTVISLVLAALFSNQIAGMIQTTLERFQGHNTDIVNIETITSKRLQILEFYLTELVTNPMLLIFGYGLQYNQTEEYLPFYYIAHNTFLDLVLSWGIVGVLMFCVIFYQLIKPINRHRTGRLSFNHFVPMIVTGITFLALSCLDATMFWWIIFATLLPLRGLNTDAIPVDLGHRTDLPRRRVHIAVR